MCFNPGYPCECLTSGNLCEPCKTTAKDREQEEAHLSNNINSAEPVSSVSEPEMETPSTEVARDRGRNWGWMLSAIICLNILILGCAFVSGTTSGGVKISTPDLQIYIILLFLLTMIWMVYYTIYNSKAENVVVLKDKHAGPIWLRGKVQLQHLINVRIISWTNESFSSTLHDDFPSGGLLLFGILSVIMDIFKIASYVGYLHCDSAVKVAFPVVQLVFVLVQVKKKKKRPTEILHVLKSQC